MPLANDAAWVMRRICDVWNIGYSQPGRWNIYDGGTTDCSAACAYAYNAAGISPRFPYSSWTGSLREEAEARGFVVLYYSHVGPYPGNLAVGDMLLSERASGGTGHVAMVTGDNEVSEAWIAETGDIDGAPGDQTGGETRTVSFTGHPNTVNGAWTHVLRPPYIPSDYDAPESAPAPAPEPEPEIEDDDMVLIRTTTPWNTYAYALCDMSGKLGARALTQEEADLFYKITRFAAVGWETYNEMIRWSWQFYKEYHDSIGAEVKTSVDAAVAQVNEDVKRIWQTVSTPTVPAS